MALMPKRVKFRKFHKGRVRGNATRGNNVSFGEYGLQSLESERITAQQIEAGFSAPSQRVKVSLPANCIAPAVSVAGDGSLWVACAQTRTTTTVTKGAVTTKALILR